MRYLHYPSIGSTSVAARELAESEIPLMGLQGFEPVWISADTQTDGKGRNGRTWVSQSGNLFCTGLYIFFGSAGDAARLSFVAAIALYDVLAEIIDPQNIVIKWPNDVLVDGKKIAGILLESGEVGPTRWVSIGIGLNINSEPDIKNYGVTRLMDHLKPKIAAQTINPQSILERLSLKFDYWREQYERDGFACIRTAWEERALGMISANKGEENSHIITARLPHQTHIGHALGLDEDGALRIRITQGTRMGKVVKIHAGDVFFSPKTR